ncbi:MAG: DNA-binding protein [Actinobacteria bacterium]|nr:DNA-binding protein [Actinomycetota bacterium]
MPEELLTRHEAADRAGVSYGTILHWIEEGRLAAQWTRVGKSQRQLVRASELERAVVLHRDPRRLGELEEKVWGGKAGSVQG